MLPVQAKETVSILRALNLINTPLEGNKTRVFSIGWIRISGERKGTFKYIPAAMKYIKSTCKGGPVAPKNMPNLKESKLLLLEDIQHGTLFYVPIYSIIEFDGVRVKH